MAVWLSYLANDLVPSAAGISMNSCDVFIKSHCGVYDVNSLVSAHNNICNMFGFL